MILALVLALVLTASARAQFVKDTPSERIQSSSQTVFSRPAEWSIGSFLGNIIDDKHFQMSHSYSLSYNSLIGNTTGEYVNTITYKFDAPVLIRTDIGLMHQPFGASQKQLQSGFGANDFSGVYLKNAQVLWKPTKNMIFSASFQQVPANQWLNGFNGFGGNGFNRFGGGFGNGFGGSMLWSSQEDEF